MGNDASVCTYNPVTGGRLLPIDGQIFQNLPQSRQSAIKCACWVGRCSFVAVKTVGSEQHCHQSMAHASHLGR